MVVIVKPCIIIERDQWKNVYINITRILGKVLTPKGPNMEQATLSKAGLNNSFMPRDVLEGVFRTDGTYEIDLGIMLLIHNFFKRCLWN